MVDMLELFAEAMEKRCGLFPGKKVLAAVSGGIDSIALLNLLVRTGYEVVVGHLDHGLRDSSKADQKFVSEEAARLGLPSLTGRVDTARFTSEKKLSMEEAARELRYEFLFTAAGQNGCKAVAVGHHADDQAETVLLHILRGSGLKGLAGMPYSRITQWHPEIRLVRPLLGITKAELVGFCSENNLATIKDETNEDIGFLRNRVRHQILPEMREINPKIENGLRRLALNVEGDLVLLEGLVEESWSELIISSSDANVLLARDEFNDRPRSLQRRIIRKAIEELIPGLVDINFDLVERAIDGVINATSSGFMELAQGIGLRVNQDDFSIGFQDAEVDLFDFPQLVSGEVIEISGPGNYLLGNGWEIILVIDEEPSLDEASENQDRYVAYLDPGEGSGEIIVRKRRRGDRISPLGMGGRSMKVSNLMINESIPQPARINWPLVEVDGQIAWVPGCRVSHYARIRPVTTRGYRFEVKRIK